MADTFTLEDLGRESKPEVFTLADLRQAQPVSKIDKIATGMADPIHGAAQLLTNALPAGLVQKGNDLNNWLADKTGLVARLPAGGVDQQVREREAAYQTQRKTAGEDGFDGYRTIGNIVSPANLALSYATPAAATLPMRMLGGGASGAATSALNPITEGDYWSEKGKQAGVGLGLGVAAPLVTAGVSRIISPKASTNPSLQMLKDEGVKPTIGQTLGGWANSLEEKAQSLPLVGDLISYNRKQALEQFNNAAINRATAPLGQRVPGAGTGAVREAGDVIGGAYDAAKASLGGFRLDAQANNDLFRLRTLASNGLEGRERSAFNKYFTDYIDGNKAFTADKFKELDSKLGADIAKFGGSNDAYQQKLGDALKEVQSILAGNAMRANPKAAEALKAADAAYANLVRVEGASVSAKGADGVFTPGQLLTAVRGADKSVRDRATGRGTALMQDFATAGQKVLGNKVPDSGTAGRLAWGGLGAAAMASPMATGGLVGAGLLGYFPPTQAMLRGLVSARPQAAEPIAEALRKATPLLVPGSVELGLGLLK